MCCSDKNESGDVCAIRPIARIHTDFKEKFGVPRQTGLVPELRARIEFEPEYRCIDAIRGLENFNYIWLIFGFSKNRREDGSWSPLVRPPRLGGKIKVGVFATRSPFRPNSLGLSSVPLLDIDRSDPANPALIVGGADLLDGTPIYDIKPYARYADCHTDALKGFMVENREFLNVEIPDELLEKIEPDKREALKGVLAQDPRAPYEKEPDNVFGMRFAGYDVRFTVDQKNILRVTGILPADAENVK